MLMKKYQVRNTITVLNTKNSEVENKISHTGSLVTTTVLNTKISEVENKFPDNYKYITTQEFKKFTCRKFFSKIKSS